MRIRRLLLLIVALVLVVAACGGDDDAGDTTDASDAGETTSSAPADDTTAAPETSAPPAETTTTMEAPAETTTTAAAGGEGETGALGDLQSAIDQTEAATSGRMEGEIAITGLEGVPGGGNLTMPFSGAFDNESEIFQFAMDMSGFAEAAGEEVPPGFEDLLGEMEILQVGDVAYMKFPLFTAMLGVETEWIRLPAEDAGAAAEGFGGFAPTNPGDFLGAFGDAEAEVTEVGQEDVRGVSTTHYMIVVDIAALRESLPPDEQAELDAQGPLPVDVLPLDIWIGEDGYVYRYVMNIDGSSIESAPGEGFESMTMTFEMFDYGTDIGLSEPDPSTVTDGEELGGLFDF